MRRLCLGVIASCAVSACAFELADVVSEDGPGSADAAPDATGGNDATPTDDSSIPPIDGANTDAIVDPIRPDAGVDAPTAAPPLVFFNTSGANPTLYALDVTSHSVASVGTLTGCAAQGDIAINAAGDFYFDSPDGFFKIDKVSHLCTLISNANFGFAAAFVPGATEEFVAILSGPNGALINVMLATGLKAARGALSGGFNVSGDFTATSPGHAAASLGGNGCSDCIYEIDPATGSVGAKIGDAPNQSYGLAYVRGFLYGFTGFGAIWVMDLGATVKTATTIPGPGGSFTGAAARPEP